MMKHFLIAEMIHYIYATAVFRPLPLSVYINNKKFIQIFLRWPSTSSLSLSASIIADQIFNSLLILESLTTPMHPYLLSECS